MSERAPVSLPGESKISIEEGRAHGLRDEYRKIEQ